MVNGRGAVGRDGRRPFHDDTPRGRRAARAGRGRRARCLIALCAVLAGCGAPPPDALRFGLAAMPVTLDPRFATDAASTRIIRLICDRLVDFDERALPVPALADWERVTPTHYRFRLRADRRPFANGEPLTALDVKATFDSILNRANGSPHRGSLLNVTEVAARGADVVEFFLERPDRLFPGRLGIGILPRSLLERNHAFNRAPLGSGPFEVVDWPDGNRLTLRRRSDGQALEFLPVPDPTVRVLKLLRGEIDMLQNDLPPELIAYLAGRPGITVQRGRGSNFAYLGFNMRDPVVGRREVRHAIAYALDRAAMIRYVLGDAARPAAALLPPDHWAGAPGLAPIAYDPQRARAFLAQAGYHAGDGPHIVYKTSTDPFRLRLATIIQQQLGQAGIRVEIRSYDWGTFYGDIKAGNFQMFSLMWVGVKLPDIFRYVFHSASVPPDGANRGRYASPLADRLIDAAEAAGDAQEQAALYRELQRQLLEDLPYVPLWYEDHVFAVRGAVQGYRIAADGNYDGLVEVRRR